VSLDWSGTGETYRERSNYTYSTPTAQTFNGQSRDASVSGFVTVDGTDLSFADGYGSLSRSNSGYFEMYR
jgi:hypothetical protein